MRQVEQSLQGLLMTRDHTLDRLGFVGKKRSYFRKEAVGFATQARLEPLLRPRQRRLKSVARASDEDLTVAPVHVAQEAWRTEKLADTLSDFETPQGETFSNRLHVRPAQVQGTSAQRRHEAATDVRCLIRPQAGRSRDRTTQRLEDPLRQPDGCRRIA